MDYELDFFDFDSEEEYQAYLRKVRPIQHHIDELSALAEFMERETSKGELYKEYLTSINA